MTQNPALKIIGARNPKIQSNGAFVDPKQELEILEEINRLSPDFIWIGLGTPKQQAWINNYKSKIRRGILLGVGFAFDVNAGIKRDAPAWMQRRGMTWIYRLCSEPRRLAVRYLRNNSLFLFFLSWDGLRGRAWRKT